VDVAEGASKIMDMEQQIIAEAAVIAARDKQGRFEYLNPIQSR